MSKFKKGDRVVYNRGLHDEDRGVVTTKYADGCMVKFDSTADGRYDHYVTNTYLEHEYRAEIMISLHTENGDVVTSYPVSMKQEATKLILSYLNDGKKFTVEKVQ
jgi:hypothetical protein